MKAKILSLAAILFIASTIITSCDEKNKKDATDVEQDMMETNQEIDDQTNEVTETSRAELNQDWDNFVATSDELYNKREEEIKGIRAEILNSDKEKRARLNQEIDDLEQKNKSLKERIDTRTESVKNDLSDLNEKSIEDHKEAQRILKRDMDDIGNAIGNFFKKNND